MHNGVSIDLTGDLLPIKVPSVFYSEREEKDKTIDGDGDGDGLMDSVEEYPILTSYGFFVNTDKEEPDTDFDGKLDGEELVSDGPVYVKRVIGYYNDQGLYVKSDKYDEFVEEYGSEITSDLACWIMTSRPDEPDSDFDFLDDSKDSEPMVSQFKTVILGGKPYYYGLDENGDAEKIPYDISKPEYDGYIIVQDGENVYYGGNQEWLSDGEKDAFDMEKGDYACGVIATHDVIQYLNGRSGTLDPYHKTEYVSSIKKYHDALADDDKLFFSDHGFIWPWNACSVINENTDGDIELWYIDFDR